MTCRLVIAIMLVVFTSALDVCSQNLKVTCEAVEDTVSINGPVILKVRLQNISRRTVRLPEGFHITSSLLPNGLKFPLEGIQLDFEIRPALREAKLFVEGLTVIKPNTFYKVRPGRHVEFEVDLGPHIQYVNDFLREEGLSFSTNLVYSITCSAANRWTYKHKGTESGAFERIESSDDAKVYVFR